MTQPSEPIPFNIPAKEISIQDYLTTLATAIATLQATQAAMMQIAQNRGGGSERIDNESRSYTGNAVTCGNQNT